MMNRKKIQPKMESRSKKKRQRENENVAERRKLIVLMKKWKV